MEKVQKFKTATENNRQKDFSEEVQDMVLVPFRVCKIVWDWVVGVWRKLWAWLRSLDVAGMVNLTLFIVIVVLFISLVVNLAHGRRSKVSKISTSDDEITVVQPEKENSDNIGFDDVEKESEKIDNVSIIDDNYQPVSETNDSNVVVDDDIVLPLKKDKSTGITPQIQVVGVEKPIIINGNVVSDESQQQKLYGDVIVEKYQKAPVLSNGVSVDGNLFIQNMRKYTLPCDAKITGNLFIRNVERLNFCGSFTVNGNIYVNRQSSFGPIPQNAHVGGQVIL